MIKLVETKGFKKDTTSTYKLTGLDFFIGDNGSGKSTLLQAIQFVLTGKIPGVAEKNQEVFKFCNNGSEMEGNVFLDNGIVTRKLYSDGKTVKEKVSCPTFLENGTIAEKNKAILDNTIGVPLVLNFNQFVAMNDGEKRKFIYSLLGEAENYNQEYVRDFLKEKGSTDEEIVNKMLSNYGDNDTIEVGLKKMQQYVETYKKLSDADRKRLEESLKQFSSVKNKAEINLRDLQGLKDEKSKLLEQFKDVEKVINQNKQKENFLITLKSKKASLSKEISMLESKINVSNRSKLQEELKKLSSIDLEKEINKIDNNILSIKNQINENKEGLEGVKIKGINVKAKIDTTTNLIVNIKSQNGCCTIDKRIKCNKDFSAYMESLNNSLNEENALREKLLNEYYTLKNEQKKREAMLISLEGNKQDLINELLKTKDNINHINFKIKDIDMNIRELELKREQLDENNRNINQYSVVNNDVCYKQLQSIKLLIDKNEIELAKCDELKANEILIEKTKTQLKQTSKEVEVYTKLNKALGVKGLQGEIVKNSLGIIEEDVNETLEILRIQGTFFFQCLGAKGKEVFNFGLKVENKLKYFETLSTGEKLMVSIAILKVIIDRCNSSTKVLVIDDIIHLDKDNRIKLYNALVILKEKGNFNNIIAMGAVDKGEEKIIPKEIKVWNKNSEGTQLRLDDIA